MPAATGWPNTRVAHNPQYRDPLFATPTKDTPRDGPSRGHLYNPANPLLPEQTGSTGAITGCRKRTAGPKSFNIAAKYTTKVPSHGPPQ